MIGFEQPQWLWAGLFALVPLVIHMIGRRPSKPIAIPSLMWLKTFQAKQRKRHRLKDLIVLLLRILAVLAVVLALARPSLDKPSKTLIIDNHPAGWEQRQDWLVDLLPFLPSGKYNVLLRGGTELNSIDKAALLTVLEQWPSSLAPLPEVMGTLLSYGFAPIDSKYASYLLPKRDVLFNALCSVELSDDKVALNTGDDKGLWKMFEGDELFLEWDSVSKIDIQLDLLKADLEYSVVHSSDLLEADNTIKIRKRSKSRRALYYLLDNQKQAATQIAKVFKVDTIIEYDDFSEPLETEFETAVLFGFDFIPEPILSSVKTLLVFPVELKNAKILEQPRANLNHPFYSKYFIGASPRNNWPSPEKSNFIDPTSEALLQDGESILSGFISQSSQRIYMQGFEIDDVTHPYYTALKQWSFKSSSVNIGTNRPLGNDNYAVNLERFGDQILFGESSEIGSENLALAQVDWDNSKIALLFALLFVLIAVIFVKIF